MAAENFEIQILVLDDEDSPISRTHLDYGFPRDQLDLENLQLMVASDIAGVLKKYLGTT